MRRTIQDKEAALDLACAALTVELLDVGNPKTVEKAQKIADAAAAVAHAASEVRRHALRVARQLRERQPEGEGLMTFLAREGRRLEREGKGGA